MRKTYKSKIKVDDQKEAGKAEQLTTIKSIANKR